MPGSCLSRPPRDKDLGTGDLPGRRSQEAQVREKGGWAGEEGGSGVSRWWAAPVGLWGSGPLHARKSSP